MHDPRFQNFFGKSIEIYKSNKIIKTYQNIFQNMGQQTCAASMS